MALELARPGTLYLALRATASTIYLCRIEDGMRGGAIFESRARPANAPAALQTSISRARAALGLQTNDEMRATTHSANVWANQLVLAPLAVSRMAAGFDYHLVRCRPMKQLSEARRRRWFHSAIHSSSHPNYDWTVRAKSHCTRGVCNNTPTPRKRVRFRRSGKRWKS